MKGTNKFYVLLLSSLICNMLFALPQKALLHQEENEECTEFYAKSMKMCLKMNQVPDYVTLKCGKLNYQNGCEIGERQVIHITKKCVSTKCIANIAGDKVCRNGEVPYESECHKIGSSNVCAKQQDLVPKRVLEADMFGEVKCNCLSSHSFLEFCNDCYSESSLNPCNTPGSSQMQLIR